MGSMKDLFGDQEPPWAKQPHQLKRRTDPGTSYEAAAAVVPKLRELQQKVYDCLKAHPGGLTDLELQDELGDHGSTYRTRRAELVELGLVVDTGRKRNLGGRNRIVWAVK